MTEAHNRLGRVSVLHAVSVGSPGDRRFHILAESSYGDRAILWMEKEQLFNLAMALKRIIAIVSQQAEEGNAESAPAEPVTSVDGPLDLQVGRLDVGYDEGLSLYLIATYGREDDDDSMASVSLMATRSDADAFADQAFSVCASGRPLCPLCGVPIDAGEQHICPKHNGHGTLGETTTQA
jgi:uncharacterized repeat protein (TIGR03847 family)